MNSALNTIIQQALRHRVFALTPKLAAIDAQAKLEEFLRVDELHASADWTLHIRFIHWLCKRPKWKMKINAEIVKESLTAAVVRWSLNGLDHINAKGILVTSQYLEDLAVGLWKSQSANEACKVVLVKCDWMPRIHAGSSAFAISFETGNWNNLNWVALPI